jgi:hypothetical protein
MRGPVKIRGASSEGLQWIALGKGRECHIVFPDVRIKACLDPNESEQKKNNISRHQKHLSFSDDDDKIIRVMRVERLLD